MKKIFLFIGAIMANHLKNADSPYLKQHADNPVDWYEWGEEVFEKAKKENKLIFLSIGYSTCHWCHVMERESFENKEIAGILNKYYVSIKVDREEMSDIDKYYQKAYQLMHRRSGGWPLTIIMTPEKKVFYSATYVPPHYSQYGPGLKEILLSIANDWMENPKKILEIADNFEKYYKENENKKLPKENVDKSIIENIIKKAKNEFDLEYGGVKGAPKFPMESSLDLLIDVYVITKNKDILDILNLTLTKMAKGGIFDQVEGGFYRYSVDNKWEIPHFEKMLYNNANLPYIYLRMYKITKNLFYKEVAFKSIDEMLNKYYENGLFFSASDADSNGGEGKYFVYDFDEVNEAFSEFENKEELLNYFGIKKYGNFNGLNNPTIQGERPKNYEKALQKLKDIRKTKEFPFIDSKKITSWNAMMIKTLFAVGEFDEKYLDTAKKSLEKLIEVMYKDKLYHSFNKDEKNKKPAFLEDYAYLINALITAYEYSYEEKYLKFANKLSKEVFLFKKDNWYMNQDKSIKADFSDSSYASSLGVLANDFLDLSLLNYNIELKKEADEIIEEGSYYVKNYPLFYASITKAAIKNILGEYIITSETPLYKEDFSYPYVLWKKGESFEICTIYKCIKKSKNLEEIKEIFNIL
ncbi:MULTISPECIES: thioredoxin domain-containing protein [unclassified Lebetimonas]|uniref:thioredoxin domain-containing protein n=1 Tax=unclassified Lebetimonas TaxID=2648158 RepID=UPI0004B4DFD5|nr:MULTISPECIES: thioredoxin domain-containing protein [unclassified Lebetimonas]